MKSKKTLLLLSLVSCASLAIVAGIGGANSGAISLVKGDETTYSITCNTTQNRFCTEKDGEAHVGEAALKTNQGGEVRFAYYQVDACDSAYGEIWQNVHKGGYFYNLDPIHGIKRLTMTFPYDDMKLDVLYSRDTSFDHCQSFIAKKKSLSFDFDGYLPNYFKVVNTDNIGSFTLSMEIEYSCVDDYVSVTAASADEAMGSVSPSSATLRPGEQTTITASPNTGRKFLGWYNDDGELVSEETSYTVTAETEDLSFTARFADVLYSLSVTSVIEGRGSATTSVSGSYYYLDPITVSATPKEGYLFAGWYSQGVLVSPENPYTFAMPAMDYKLSAVFQTQAEKEEKERVGFLPLVDLENGSATFGLYPQTRVSDEATIASLEALTSTNGNGWYRLNDDYYAKKEAAPYHFYNYTPVFDDGTAIESGKTYWFKCEPITWRILSSDEDKNEYFLLATVLLDAHNYGEHSNNYKDSELRRWLNDEFYYTAFGLENTQAYIRTTTVDNSASTTKDWDNKFCCEDTEDNVFSPSFKDYTNTEYGFWETFSAEASCAYDPARKCRTTDWARANGAFYYKGPGEDTYNGDYWTRSPYAPQGLEAMNTGSFDGSVFFDSVSNSSVCVRPCINLKVA